MTSTGTPATTTSSRSPTWRRSSTTATSISPSVSSVNTPARSAHMLSPEDNAVLTLTGPGTAMGAVLRRYWIPAVLSSEIPDPDCPPVRVKVLGEDLVAFRDSSGRIGLLQERCAHRCA